MLARGTKSKIKAPRRGLVAGGGANLEKTWETLSGAFEQIHTKNASLLSYESLYREAYKLVLKKEGQALYNKLKAFERNWLSQSVAQRIIKRIPDGVIQDEGDANITVDTNERKLEGEALMRALKEAWEDHVTSLNMISDVMTYLDRVYCAENRIPGIVPMAMALFRDNILGLLVDDLNHQFSIGEALVRIMLEQVQMDRHGYQIDKPLVRSVAVMLEGLYSSDDEDESSKLYLTMFESRYLEQSRRFFREEGETLILSVDAASWCSSAKKRLEEEEQRCRSTLSQLTAAKIKAAVDDEFIKPFLKEAISMPGSGVQVMLDNDKADSLKEVYELSARIDPTKLELKQAVQERIETLGNTINEAALANAQKAAKPPDKAEKDEQGEDGKAKPPKPKNPQIEAAVSWVEEVLQLKLKYDKILVQAFDDDKALQSAFTQSFTKFINASDRSSEYLSLFFDENMKSNAKGKTDAEIDQFLDNGITLLRYIQDKDLFERYYKRHLSRRLLMKRSASMDMERQMIIEMKVEVGNSFTNRIEAMFKDMSLSEDLAKRYKDHISSSTDSKRTELYVDVLTSSMWPSETISAGADGSHSTCNFPPAMQRIKQSFEKFYLDQHSGRKLTWQANMGTADLKVYFPKIKGNIKMRELNVSTYAMVILLLFQDMDPDESLTCEEIQARTNIPMNELTRNLQSLSVAPKTRILVKTPMSRDIKPTDKFSFNDNFQSQFQRIKVGVVSSTNRIEGVEERKDTEKRNNEDRGAVMDAAIVRIMKQRKTLTHPNLVTEVLEQLAARFKPDIGLIKKRIENLIDRDYLERTEGVERAEYKYLA